ncbi:hypothetical protein [Formosa haliotis]|uniref:hypothetical protein n=1 Tax=Formosa haliotis TaxID=1555194 RepID=UPI00082619D2|nr:hypothetical protein [Formosa haliotis]
MKTIYIVMALLCFSGAIAQTTPKEVLEETKTVTTKVDDGKGVTEKKVEVNTRVEQDVKLADEDKNKVNQSRVHTPSEVTETVKITDNSPFTTDKKVINYRVDGKTCTFTMDEEGFLITDPTNSSTMKVEQSEGDSSQFVVNDKGETGIGYFDDNGNFVVQQFDKNSNKIVSKTYTLVE